MPDSELLHSISYNNGQTTTYSYEPDRDLKTRVQNSYGGQVISQYDYTQDAVGRRNAAANSGSAFAQAAFSAYSYNDRSELIAADRYLGTDVADTTNPVGDEQRAYLYDPIGNRTRAEEAGVQTAYSANELNQYTDIAGITSAYDPDGNMITDHQGKALIYNAENRLVAVRPETPAEGDTRVEFTYDFQGCRVQKIVSTYNSGTWVPGKEILFVYDGWNLIKETTITNGSNAVDKYYIWGLDLSLSMQGAGGIGGLLAAVDSSLTYQYLYDANGNVGQVVDAADGSIAAHYEYDPFGNLVDQAGAYADQNPYRFSTKYFDSEISLYYYGYRYYSAELGRWINRDPISIKQPSKDRPFDENSSNGSDTNFITLYVFIENNSSNNVDHLGLYTIKEALLKEFKESNPNYSSADSWKKKFEQWVEKRSYQERFDAWYKYEQERAQGKWWVSLPPCPNKLCITSSKNAMSNNYVDSVSNPDPAKWKDPGPPGYAELALHPGTIWSMRSKTDANGHSNQCTYYGNGFLIRLAPGAGTVDWRAPGAGWDHYDNDVYPIYLAQFLDGGKHMSLMPWSPSILTKPGPNMRKYYEVRPLYAEPE